MKKIYVIPSISVLFVETESILAGSGGDNATDRLYTGGSAGDETIGVGTSTSGSTFEKGQGGGGSRAKGDNGLWDDSDW